jgi:hypothetical protein
MFLYLFPILEPVRLSELNVSILGLISKSLTLTGPVYKTRSNLMYDWSVARSLFIPLIAEVLISP